jgi:two-component system, NtrC family, sensor histidine kinase HydH
MVSRLKVAMWPHTEAERVDCLRWIAIVGSIAVCGGLHFVIPHSLLHWYNLLTHLYYLPIVFAGMYFGWRGGLTAGILVGLSSLPHTLRLLTIMPPYASDQLLDIPVFCAAGVFTGILSRREREQRLALERTTTRLTEVYRELQESFEQVKRAERMSALGQLSAGLAHEIRNPLASLAGAAGILKRSNLSEARHGECVEIIQKECERLNRLLTQFLEFARPRKPRHKFTDLRGLLGSVTELAAHANATKQVRILLDVAPNLPIVECDPEQIEQAILNLLINAIHASSDLSEVKVAARSEQDRIVIQVIDEGEGVEGQLMDKIFDPFFTTKENGTGLGLSVAHQIAQQHGGLIMAEPNVPRGTRFSIVLPRLQGALQ